MMKSPNTRSPLHVTFLCIIIAVVQALSVNATIYDIPCAGDDFKAKLATVQPGDIIQLAASCTYDLSYFENGEQRVYDLASDIPDANFLDEDAGFIIRGGSANPADTIVNARITDCEANILFENLSLSPQSDRPVEIDSDETTVFRNCIIELNAGYDNIEAIYQMSHVISVIYSTIVNNDQSSTGTIGINTEENFTLLRSTVTGFDTGLSWDNGNDPMNNDDIIFGNDLTGNTQGCCVYAGYYNPCDACLLDNNPNTGAGRKVSVWGLRNLMSEDEKKLQLRIWIPEVAETGQTVGYRIPAAFPVKPDETLKIGTTPQYYQFHSTARLKKQGAGKARISFKSFVMKKNFDDPTKIVAYFHTGVRWRPLNIQTKVKNGKEFYRVKIPKRFYLNGVVAFFETA